MDIVRECAACLERVRERRPLVHHLTNYVTVNDCANVTLAIGASPVMANAPEEAGEIAASASSVVLNIGTLNADMAASMVYAGKDAGAKGVPVVFDPVGAGASAFRRAVTARILDEVAVSVLRCNVSEMLAVCGMASSGRGVDANPSDGGLDVEQIAMALARKRRCVVAVTGARDVVTDGATVNSVENGHPMLTGISGTGCMCTSLVGAFLGADPGRPLLAATAALLCMGVAGEIAFARAGGLGLGSYRQAVMDAISLLDGTALLEKGKARAGLG